MGLLKLKKNRKYNYKPRYYKGEGNPYEVKHKFDEHRTTINPAKGIKGKVNAAINDLNNNKDDNANKRVMIIAGILMLFFLAVFVFDFPNLF